MSEPTDVSEAEIEAAAAVLGKHLGPLDGESRWCPGYLDKVQWPKDYSEQERTLLRSAAIVALEAAARVRANANQTGGDCSTSPRSG